MTEISLIVTLNKFIHSLTRTTREVFHPNYKQIAYQPGAHWLVLNNLGYPTNEVKIYDLAFDDIPYLEHVTASIMDTKASELQMIMIDVKRQTDGNDWSIFHCQCSHIMLWLKSV